MPTWVTTDGPPPDWDGRRRPNIPNRSGHTSFSRVEVDEDFEWDDNLRRARTQGNGPMPNINIFNRMDQDEHNQTTSPGRDRFVMPGGWTAGSGAAPARSHSRGGEIDAEELERRRREWRRQAKEDEEESRKREQEAIKNFRGAEDQRRAHEQEVLRGAKMQDEERARREKQLIHEAHVKDEERKMHEQELVRQARLADDAKNKAEKERIDVAIREADEKKRKALEDRKALLHQAELERAEEQKKKKDERERVLREIHEEKIAKEEKEKAEFEEFERKLAAKKAKEKEDKEKKESEYMDRVNHDFQRFGFTQSQIKEMVHYDEEKAKQSQLTVGEFGGRSRSRSLLGQHRPVFPKIHREDIAVETLRYYELDWEYDHHHRDYIIIKHELTHEETDELFAHTRHLKHRSTPKLLEDKRGRSKENEYMWIKKRDKSRGKSRDGRGIRVGFAESLVRHL